MDRLIRTCPNNLLIIVESSRDPHKEIIQSTVAKRAYEIFEKRGCQHGFDLEDGKHVPIECPRDLEVTTILSMTAHSLVVFGAIPD
jgi:hypothetical protein